MRDHIPITLEQFNGLWDRGDVEEVPQDHFSDCENLKFIASSGFGTRDGINAYQDVLAPLDNVVRKYNYLLPTGSTLLVLTWDGTTGKIYHIVDATTVYGPILTITGMLDFAFAQNASYAFISPFGTFTQGNLNIEKGLQNEFVYVYKGDGTAARKAAGSTPAGTLAVANGAVGHTDAGIHLFAVVGETDTGYLSAPVGFIDFTTAATFSLNFSNIPVFTGAQWVKRHIVATAVIPAANWDGNFTGFDYFFIPDATVNDNSTTTLTGISFYDADLLDDASHLFDNYSEIPAGAVLGIYKGRLVVAATYTDISLALLSAVGEPEAISQVSGLLIVPLDGNPITNSAELRDILYLFKRNRTIAYVDNGEEPSNWQGTIIDYALGCPVHGIASVIDSGEMSIDYLIVATYKGICVFNGTYQVPELSWKIQNFWINLDRTKFRFIQLINDTITQLLYCVLPDNRILIGNYVNGMTANNIIWCPIRAALKFTSIAMINIDQLIFGAESANLSLRLFSNDFTPTVDSVLADFTQVTGGGYAAKALSFTDASVTVINGLTYVQYTPQIFNFSGAIGGGGSAYGYYIVDTRNDNILFAQRVSQYTPGAGDSLNLTLLLGPFQ